MQVQWHKFLQQLNLQCEDDLTVFHHCPLHPTSPERTLRVFIDPVTKAYQFSCIHSKCHFEGDAVQLLARVRDLSIEDAVLAFAEPPLSHCLNDTLLATQIQDYLDHRRGQAHIREYLERCNARVFEGTVGNETRSLLRAAKISHEKGLLPRDLCSVDPVNPPQPLAVFGKKMYHTGRYVMYPYAFESQITQIDVQKVDSSGELGPIDTHPLNDCGLGVFPASALESPEDRILICESPIFVCRFTALWKYGYNHEPPLLHTLGFPLPSRAKGKKLYLLDTLEQPLSLEYALRAYAAEEQVLGAPPVSINVLPCPYTMTTSAIRSRHRVKADYKSLIRWLSDKLLKLASDDQLEYIMDTVQRVGLTDEKREALIDYLIKSDAPGTLLQVLTDTHILGQGELRLANNMCITRRSDGLYTHSGGGAETRLSNILIRVDSSILTAQNEIIYNCSFKHRDVDLVRGQLTTSDISSANKLQKAITSAYVKSVNQAVYVACYDCGKNYKWPDIMAKLAEGVQTYKEVTELGIDDNLHIQLPNFAVDLTTHTVQPQKRIFTLNQNVIDGYAGVIPGDNDADAMANARKLFENCDNMYVGAFIAGVCHVIYTLYMQYHTQLHTHGRAAPRTHLCYAEPADNVWGGTFDYLNMLFSDLARPSYIDTNAREHLGRMTELGTLPYIAYLPAWPIKRLKSLFQDSPVNLITRVDGAAATMLSEELGTSFIIPSTYRAADANALHPNDVYNLQRALPALLCYLFKQPRPNSLGHEIRRPSRPAYATYQHICDVLDVEPRDTVNELIEEYYTAAAIGAVQSFCAGLSKIIYKDATLMENNPTGVDVVERIPSKKDLACANPPLVFVTKKGVLVNKRMVDVVKRVTRDNTLSTATLERELLRDEYVIPSPFGIDIDVNSYWTFDREIWDCHIKQERLSLVKPVGSGEIIHLKQLTA